MSFKERLKKLFVLGSMFLIFVMEGCGLQLGESPPENSAQTIGESYDCLEDITAVVSDYFLGHERGSEIHEKTKCLSDALSEFRKYVKGQEKNNLKPMELRRFFEKYFVTGKKISNSLSDSTMGLKVALVGGSSDRVSDEEIAKIIKILDQVRPILKKYEGIFPVELGNVEGLSPDGLIQRVFDVERFAFDFGDALTSFGTNYHWDKMKTFVENLKDIADGDTKDLNLILDDIEFVQLVVSILNHNQSQAFSLKAMPNVLRRAGRWYGVFAKINYLQKKGHSFQEGWGFETFTKAMNMGLDLLESSVEIRSAPVVSLNEIFDFISQMTYKREYFKEIVKYEKRFVLKDTLCPLILQMVNDHDFPPCRSGYYDNFDDVGLNVKGVQRIREQFESWQKRQAYLNFLFDQAEAREGLKIESAKRAYSVRELFPEGCMALGALKDRLGDWSLSEEEEVRRMICGFRPIFYANELNVAFPWEHERKRYLLDQPRIYTDISHRNWILSALELLVGSYATELDQGIKLPELVRFYKDTRELGIEIKQVDPRFNNSAERRFQDGNLFTYHANGNGFLDAEEGTELLSFLISGKKLARKLYDTIGEQCDKKGVPRGKIDVYGYTMLQPQCFRRELISELLSRCDPVTFEYRRHPNSWFARLPGFEAEACRIARKAVEKPQKINFATKKEESKPKGIEAIQAAMDDFVRQLELASRLMGDADDHFVEYYDIESIGVLLHYVESLFQRFDLNQDGAFSRTEILQGFDIFEGIIRPISKTSKRSTNQYVFTFVLENGKLPTGDKIEYGSWFVFSKPVARYNLLRAMGMFNSIQNGKMEGLKLPE